MLGSQARQPSESAPGTSAAAASPLRRKDAMPQPAGGHLLLTVTAFGWG